MQRLQQRPAPGKWSAAIFSLVTHGGLALLLFYGVQWQRREEPPVAVALISSLPPINVPAQAPQPRPAPPRAEPTPPPPPVAKPDIEIKTPEKKPEPKKPEPKPEPPKPEPKKDTPRPAQSAPAAKPAPQPATPDRVQQMLAAEEQRAQQAQRDAKLAAELNRIGTVVSNIKGLEEREGVIGGWKHQVQERVRNRMGVLPPGLSGCPTAVFDVELLPVGLIKGEPVLRKSSGNTALDDMIRRAIIASEPFPTPPPEAVGKPNPFEFDPKNCKQR